MILDVIAANFIDIFVKAVKWPDMEAQDIISPDYATRRARKGYNLQ